MKKFLAIAIALTFTLVIPSMRPVRWTARADTQDICFGAPVPDGYIITNTLFLATCPGLSVPFGNAEEIQSLYDKPLGATISVCVDNLFVPPLGYEEVGIRLWNPTRCSFPIDPNLLNTGTIQHTYHRSIDDSRFFVRQQYLDTLGRVPDKSGWDYWTNRINSCGSDSNCYGPTRAATALAFMYSDEFLRNFPGLRNPPGVTPDFNNGAFVRVCYLAFLRRQPDQGGWDYWTNVLNGYTAGNPSNYGPLVSAFITSTEYRSRFNYNPQ